MIYVVVLLNIFQLEILNDLCLNCASALQILLQFHSNIKYSFLYLDKWIYSVLERGIVWSLSEIVVSLISSLDC